MGKTALCTPSGHERNLLRILMEAYNLRVLVFVKLLPTVLLRIGKTLAWVFNAAVGRVLCCWNQGESRILDFVGRNTNVLCRKLYDEDVDQELVRAFLVRRFLFASLTSTATVLQVALQLVGVPLYAVLITFLLLPITLIDKQLATLVTKMIPRYDRSQIEQLVGGLTQILRAGPYPDVPEPPRVRSAGAHRRCLNLTVLEMCVGGTQFLAGLLIVTYSLMLLMDESSSDGETLGHGSGNLVDAGLVPRYFDAGDGRCELGALCVAPTTAVVSARCVKELTNWLSPWIEWRITPHKYSSNATLLRKATEAMVDHAGGAEKLRVKVRRDEQTRRGFSDIAHKFLMGGEAVARQWEQQQMQRQNPLPLPPLCLPTHLRNIEMHQSTLSVVALMCWCVEYEAGIVQLHGGELCDSVGEELVLPQTGKVDREFEPGCADSDPCRGDPGLLYKQLFAQQKSSPLAWV